MNSIKAVAYWATHSVTHTQIKYLLNTKAGRQEMSPETYWLITDQVKITKIFKTFACLHKDIFNANEFCSMRVLYFVYISFFHWRGLAKQPTTAIGMLLEQHTQHILIFPCNFPQRRFSFFSMFSYHVSDFIPKNIYAGHNVFAQQLQCEVYDRLINNKPLTMENWKNARPLYHSCNII